MKLIDLSPVWLEGGHVFAFKCPCGHGQWLTCKDVAMRDGEQFDLFEKEFGVDWNLCVTPCKPSFSWTFSTRDFHLITVTPSIDASRSGGCTWHGHITNGVIT